MELDVGGARIFFKEVGQGELVVLVHGTGATADIWDGVLPLLGHNRRAIAYDRRGWMRSQGAPHPRSAYNQGHGRDLIALIRSFNAGPATVVATSAGGFHALHAALEAPDCFAHLVLHEPPLHAAKHVTFDMFRVFVKVLALRAFGRKRAAAHTFIRSLLTGCGGRDGFAALPEGFRRNLDAMVDLFWIEAGVGSGEEITARTLRDELRVPVSFLLGSCSARPLQDAMSRLRAIRPDVPVVPIAEGNHVAMIERPEAFAAAVEQALAAVTPGRAVGA